jgi:methane/ammonia monooxygenase subunit A
VAVDSKTLELRALKDKQYRWIDRKWDLVFWVTAAFVVGAAADITKQLFAGDWDFWTDWKDRQWWPIITPFAIIIGSALQYIQWLAWRFPTGMTYTAGCMFLCTLVGRWLQWGAFVYYPMNFVWPATGGVPPTGAQDGPCGDRRRRPGHRVRPQPDPRVPPDHRARLAADLPG